MTTSLALWEQVLSAPDPPTPVPPGKSRHTGCRRARFHMQTNAESPSVGAVNTSDEAVFLPDFGSGRRNAVAFQEAGESFIFLGRGGKNYTSFNVITGLTRTESLCLLLCPPLHPHPSLESDRQEATLGVLVQSLMTTPHPFSAVILSFLSRRQRAEWGGEGGRQAERRMLVPASVGGGAGEQRKVLRR